MLRPLVLVQSPVTREALRAVAALRLGEGDTIPARAVVDSREGQASDLFRELSGWIEQEFGETEIAQDELVILVDAVRPDDLNPIGSNTWNAAVGMLILAFPEVRWFFGVSSASSDKDQWQSILRWHGLAAFLARIEGNPLFDGSGLRGWVRQKAKETKTDGADGEKLAPYIPLRPKWAAAIDDEAAYAYLNAYICYRFGFRAWALNSDRAFHLVFGDEALPSDSADLTFEDFYLGFPDKTKDVRYSNLGERDGRLSGLKRVGRRYFLTTGHRGTSANEPGGEGNAAILYALRASDRGGEIIFKPIPGIFALWQKVGLFNRLASFDADGRRQRGHAPGYVWPPTPSNQSSRTESTGHSAPGRLLQVSEFLIVRAERLMNRGVHSAPEAVRGAVMASVAQELLGDRTPTTARDALELKHRFEVIAECQFGGVEFNIDLRPRFEEIKSEMHTLGEWFSRHQRDVSLLNGELTLIGRLMAVFRDHGEFDEAEACLRQIRDLQRKIWARQTGWRAWPILPVRWYIEKLVGSTQLLFWVILAWIGFFFLAQVGYDWWSNNGDPHWLKNLSESVKHFLGGEPWSADDGDCFKVGVSVFAAVWGFLHLGILISHIYRLVSRT